MASTRKLLSEIDRTLKKTNDGLDYFDLIWDKVYSASSSSQRDKHEADLKKEIKKLQRFRDQIKNWIANPDAKEKHVAMTNVRKEVELKMEQFKICEREVKTKAYSREGLALQQKLDPEEQAKLATRDWVRECISKLEEQVEALESDLEKIHSAKNKRGKKAEIQTLETLVTRHKWHILKLEQVTRLLDNDCLTKDQVDSFKDDIEYYLEANMEADFMEIYGEDNIYEALDLDALGAEYHVTDVSASLPNRGDDSDPTSGSTSTSTPQFVESSLPIVGRAGAVKPAELRSTKSSSKYSKSSKTTSSSSSTSNSEDKASRRSTTTTTTTPSSSSSVIGGEQQPSMAALLRKQQQAAAAAEASASASSSSGSKLKKTSSANHYQPTPTTSRPTSSKNNTTTSSAHDSSTLSSKSTVSSNNVTETSPVPAATQPPPPPASLQQTPTPAPLSAPVSQPLNEEHHMALRMLETSFSRIPTGNDSDRVKQYVPRNPYPTPSVFPSTPSTVFDHSAVFEKFDTDTLFFIFYYQQGTYQQYLAARELKKQTWAYHKKYMTWFKRHEEPKVTTEEYEQGTYVYFDYETGWCQRIKSEFTFEYNFLEDELTV